MSDYGPGVTVAGSGTDRETEPVTITLHGNLSANPVFKRKRQPPNERCACGSGRKYKKCCNLAEHERDRLQRAADDAERQRRWEASQATAQGGTRRRLNPATAVILAMVGAVSK